ncbi:MAG: hypothetical protein H7256_15375 [Bdellovibrio sp.]|nr:hypothetical protein [Bdellovibrio sp.]
MTIYGEGNRLTNEAILQLGEHTDMIECECPTHLIAILKKIRAFSEYSQTCIEKFPKDEKMHKWLLSASLNLDTLLSGTIGQLARHEGFINESNEFVARKS